MARRKNYELIEKFYGDDENICFHFAMGKGKYVKKFCGDDENNDENVCFHFMRRKGKYVEKAEPMFIDNGQNYLVVRSSFRPIVELFNEDKLEEFDGKAWKKVVSDRLYIDKPLTYYRTEVEGWRYTISTYKTDKSVSVVHGMTKLYSELELIIKELKSNQTIKINKP